jgi:hypothetical protein
MTVTGFHLTEGVAKSVDPDMTLSDIARLIAAMNQSYPSEKTRLMAKELVGELGEVYLDRMCRTLMEAPIWNKDDLV